MVWVSQWPKYLFVDMRPNHTKVKMVLSLIPEIF